MLIYNYKKEFLGIDESDLKSLGLKDLEELKREASDFADLFVKTPGYIHNFKHVHWIDFIACANSSEESKVIININNKNYRATITINRAFLVDSPSSKAYLIHLNKLVELSNKDTQEISKDIANKSIPSREPYAVETFDSLVPVATHNSEPATQEYNRVTHDPYETPLEIDLDMQTDDTPLELQESIEVAPEIIEETIDMEDLVLDIEDSLSIQGSETPVTEKTFSDGYVFDPSIAAEELGLPLELIEEFICDFIEQSKDFKNALYASLNECNCDDLKILSHKLKGVAANLRIENALEALVLINSSEDALIIEENLAKFYNIIAKLAGDTITVEKPTEVAQIATKLVIESIPEPKIEKDDEFTIDFKDDYDDLYSDPVEVPEPALSVETTEPESTLDIDEPEVTPEAAPKSTYSKVSTANDIGLDQETFNELFDDYVNESKIIIQNIQEATKIGDFVTSSHEAIKLRGMGDNMRITSFNEELKTIINSSDNEVIREAISTIDAIIAQISQAEV
ncbi:Hpt domain-containing protein [Sulfurimonas sp.]|jgi:hypothetical protein|uniref:Hpt domain-containing protein n=1 Tax=Sulfurimonas sp. TaxID=2022749 RepID=UPI0025EEB462|nr:Hpt domain-containing protein [Sulfurimonas sp.]MBT5933966.1 Hpt domain-containing protein [Sulfurimonas sp.]